MLEVAIFGAVIIMLLGVLISYGLRYNYQQQTMQQSFRKSLVQSVKQPGLAESNLVIKDVHVPNPSDVFGIGSVYPFSGAAGSVARDYKMGDETPDLVTELPRVALNIQGSKCPGSLLSPVGSDPPCYYLTAGFRDEFDVSGDSEGRMLAEAKYALVYGSGNFWVTGSACPPDSEPLPNPVGGSPDPESCSNKSLTVRIIDSSAGEIIDYGTTLKQCRMIVDPAACEKECKWTNDPTVDCSGICAQTMNVPWYCETQETPPTPDHQYTFTKLNQLFASSSLRAMGLQQDYSQNVRTDNSTLIKEETASGIQTSDKLDYKTTTTRNIIYNNALDAEGVSKEAVNISQLPLKTTTQIVTCEKNATDCPYGYKVAICSGESCGQSAVEEKWPEVKW